MAPETAADLLDELDDVYQQMIDRMEGDEEAVAQLRNNLAQAIHAQFLRNVDDDTLIPEPYRKMLAGMFESIEDLEDEEAAEQHRTNLVNALESQVHNTYRATR